MVTLQSLLRDKAFYRDVAQLVAHYVRDVGVVRSSRIIPTKGWNFRSNPLSYYPSPRPLSLAERGHAPEALPAGFAGCPSRFRSNPLSFCIKKRKRTIRLPSNIQNS